MKRMIRRVLRRLGYDILKIPATPKRIAFPNELPPAAEPVWPLPRGAHGLTDTAIREQFSRYPHWHYAYEFQGGLSFSTAHNNPGLYTDNRRRPLQRFRHFMPYVVQAAGGTLRGKRVLDIACNSGFWSIQCALLGADVVGFDARPELIEQANLLKRITGLGNVDFKLMNFWRMSPDQMGGQFDVVLNLGFLYHVPRPLEALELTIGMARKHILLDTALYPSDVPLLYLKWEEPFDIRMAAEEGIVAEPTRSSVEMMLRHLKVKQSFEIPVRTNDLPLDYLTSKRASWLIEV